MLRAAFLASEVVQLAKITYRQLEYWTKTGLIEPGYADSGGSGKPNKYDFKNLLEARTIKELRNRGVSLQKIRKCLEYIEAKLPEYERPLSELLLVTDGETIFALVDSTTIIDVLKRGQLVFAIAFGDIWREMETQVREFKEIQPSSNQDEQNEQDENGSTSVAV